MGDISTWMELLKDGHVCVFLDEKLSAFRDHPAQNTHKPETFLYSYLDWMNLYVLSYLHHVYLLEKADFIDCCDSWNRRFRRRLSYLEEYLSNLEDPAFATYQQEIHAIESKDYKQVIELSIAYMTSTGADPDVFLAGTAMERKPQSSLERNGHAGQ